MSERKPTTPNVPLRQADAGVAPDAREAANPIFSARFSRKRCLGLLGAGVGDFAWRGGLLAKAGSPVEEIKFTTNTVNLSA